MLIRKADDDSYSFYNCDECKATSKIYLMNIKSLKDIRQKNVGKILIGRLNINSIREKFDSLIEITTGNMDIIMILEKNQMRVFQKIDF